VRREARAQFADPAVLRQQVTGEDRIAGERAKPYSSSVLGKRNRLPYLPKARHRLPWNTSPTSKAARDRRLPSRPVRDGRRTGAKIRDVSALLAC